MKPNCKTKNSECQNSKFFTKNISLCSTSLKPHVIIVVRGSFYPDNIRQSVANDCLAVSLRPKT